tara:strand:+ start:334 stop:627 length:294 start_codon:yes stop_codon:yes gene_type:complete
MVARPKRSMKKTIRKVIDSFKKPKPKRDPSVYKTGPGRKPKKLPKVSDLLYRPKRDKDGKIIKPKPRDLLYRPKYDSKGNIIKPKAIPMKVRKPKKK